MPNATVRANARTLPKPKSGTPAALKQAAAPLDDNDMLARERIDHVLEQVHDAAEKLHRAYYSEGRAA
jgi:hypothetical protein